MSEHGESGGLRELLAVFGFEVDKSGLEKGENRLVQFGEKVKDLAEGFAAAFAVGELFEFVEGQVQAATAVERTAAALGLSTEKVQAWQYAAKSMGMEGDTILSMMGRLQASSAGAAEKGSKGAAAFTALGISVKDAGGKTKSADELFTSAAEAISKIKDPAKAAAASVQLFGRGGRQLLPMLKEGSKGIEEMLGKFHELGGGRTKEAIEAAKQFEKQSAGLNLVMMSLKSSIATALMPVLGRIVEWATRAVKWFKDITANSNIVKAALVLLGIAGAYFAVQMAIAFAPVILIAAALAGLALIVDDIITMFEGGDSLIGEGIDKLFGKGSTTKLVEELKQMWKDITSSFKELWPYVKNVWEAFQWIFNHLPAIQLLQAAIRNNQEKDYIFNHPDSPSVLEDKRRERVANVFGSTPNGNPFGGYHPALSGGLQFDGAQAGVLNIEKIEVNPPAGMSDHQATALAKDVGKEVHKQLKGHMRTASSRVHRAPSR